MCVCVDSNRFFFFIIERRLKNNKTVYSAVTLITVKSLHRRLGPVEVVIDPGGTQCVGVTSPLRACPCLSRYFFHFFVFYSHRRPVTILSNKNYINNFEFESNAYSRIMIYTRTHLVYVLYYVVVILFLQFIFFSRVTFSGSRKIKVSNKIRGYESLVLRRNSLRALFILFHAKKIFAGEIIIRRGRKEEKPHRHYTLIHFSLCSESNIYI